MEPHPLALTLNGTRLLEQQAAGDTTLLHWLRATTSSQRPRLTATKEGCAEGDCGACCVLVRPSHDADAAYVPQHACLRLLPSLHNHDIVTLEGLAALDPGQPLNLHRAQQRVLEGHGLQCGFCTPGFVMTLAALEQHAQASEDERLAHLAGNLCRCTGYTGVRQAALQAGFAPGTTIPLAHVHSTLQDNEKLRTNEVAAHPGSGVHYCNASTRYRAPLTLDEVFSHQREFPEAQIVAGATDLALERTLGGRRFASLLDLTRVGELLDLHTTSTIMHVGAAISVHRLGALLHHTLAAHHRGPIELLRYFASPAIAGVATIGGNLCTASPIGDLAPLLLALDARVILVSPQGSRPLALSDFFVARRTSALQTGEILCAIEIPQPSPHTRLITHKISKRREVDISSLAAAFSIELDAQHSVRELRLAFGGMAATPRRAHAAELELRGHALTPERLRSAASALARDFAPIDDHRASSWYRQTVAQNLLLDLLREVTP